MTPLGVPVTPDAPTARRWVLEELADPAYSSGETLLDRFLAWVLDQLDGLQGVGLPPAAGLLVVVAVVVAVVLVALWVAGPVRGRMTRRRSTSAVLAGDDRRSAAELRAAADAASRAGDHSTAVAERFRAVVRGLEERGLLDERPGRTAHEAAGLAGRALPDVADGLARGGDLFDDVVYGERRASAADDARVRELDDAVRAARPARTDLAAAAPGGAA